MNQPASSIAVLGASGLIGHAVATALAEAGFAVVPIARRFTPAQESEFSGGALRCDLVACEAGALRQILATRGVEIVINCVGVLQDGPSGRTEDVHLAFVDRLVQALAASERPMLLVHLSVPGAAPDDRTAFSRTKRGAEQLIAASGLPFVILRPGFVIASAAFGGSAFVRALAALPLGLPPTLADRPFAAADVTDIAQTVTFVARRWQGGDRRWSAVWDIMERHPGTVGDVIDAFRQRFGGPRVAVRAPMWLVRLSAAMGDAVALLGWSPPLRTTAVMEMARGVAGDPEAWIAATGFEPMSLRTALRRLPATVQERWFTRLYLAKAAIIAALALFWIVSGLIALGISFDAAAGVLAARGIPKELAKAVTIASGLIDVGVGVLITFRKTCRAGLIAGVLISLGYMAAATVFTPDLWIDPLGALVKTVPAIVLMVVGLATLAPR